MAISVTFDSPRSRNIRFSGSEKVRRGLANLGTYVTNGVAVTPANFGLKTLDHLDVSASIDGTELFVWDKANSKIKAFSAVGTEQTQVDISAKVFRFQAQGS